MSLREVKRDISSQSQYYDDRQVASEPINGINESGLGLQRIDEEMLEAERGPPIVYLEKESVMRDLYPLVKAVMFRTYCVFEISSTGLRIIVDDENYQQSVILVAKENFKEFRMAPEFDKIEFRILLSDLLECLAILGKEDNSSVVITYQCPGSEVCFLRRLETILVKFSIKTSNLIIPNLDFEFNDDDVECRIMMRLRPDVLFDVIRDLDKSSPYVIIKVTADSIDFSTRGELGQVTVSIPSTSEIMDDYSVVVDEIARSYKVSLIQRMVPALHCCDKISLRIDTRGMMQAQFIANQSNMMQNYIEFSVVPDLGGESSDEELEFQEEDCMQ